MKAIHFNLRSGYTSSQRILRAVVFEERPDREHTTFLDGLGADEFIHHLLVEHAALAGAPQEALSNQRQRAAFLLNAVKEANAKATARRVVFMFFV
jgi:hypothetical protein